MLLYTYSINNGRGMTYKMKLKRILSGVLVFILIISLCACSTEKKKYENRLNLLTAETQENFLF